MDRLGPAETLRSDRLARVVAPGFVELEYRSVGLVHPHLLRGMLDDCAEMLLAAQPLLVSTVSVDSHASTPKGGESAPPEMTTLMARLIPCSSRSFGVLKRLSDWRWFEITD